MKGITIKFFLFILAASSLNAVQLTRNIMMSQDGKIRFQVGLHSSESLGSFELRSILKKMAFKKRIISSIQSRA